MEADEPWHRRAQRSSKDLKVPGPRKLATMERLSPPEPCRVQDVLHQTACSVIDGSRLRSPDRGTASPHRRTERLHRSWHTRHCARRVIARGKGNCAQPPISATRPTWDEIVFSIVVTAALLGRGVGQSVPHPVNVAPVASGVEDPARGRPLILVVFHCPAGDLARPNLP